MTKTMARGVTTSQPMAASSSSARAARSAALHHGTANTTSSLGSSAGAAAAGNNAKLLDDPLLWLARGYTARFLGANISTSLLTSSLSSAAVGAGAAATVSATSAATTTASLSSSGTGTAPTHAAGTITTTPRKIQPLTNEEIEKDLRHIMAYQAACQRYHQQYYLALNQMPPSTAGAGGGSTTAATSVVSNAAATTTTTAPTLSSSQSSQQQPHPGHPQLHHNRHHPQSSVPAGASPASSVLVHGVVPGGGVVGSAAEYAALPIRLDPEEEKRLQAQRKKIGRAEYIREGLEQHYVAVRAHYVEACHKLQDVQASTRSRVSFLQECVLAAAQRVAWQRCRVQVARDVLQALQHRTMVLAQRGNSSSSTSGASAGAAGTGGSNSSSSVSHTGQAQPPSVSTTDLAPTASASSAGGNSNSPESDQQNALYNAWMQVEEEGKHQIAADAKKQKASTAKTIVWTARTEPATARGIPLLLSAASEVPERSVAWASGGVFGSHKHSLTWFSRHIPVMAAPDQGGHGRDEGGRRGVLAEDDDRGDGVDNSSSVSSSAMDRLRDEALFLEQELVREQDLNMRILKETGKARATHDEWVAMMVLVRQETESILHRHNVLLESDTAVNAATRLAAEHQMQQKQQLVQQQQLQFQSQDRPREPGVNQPNSEPPPLAPHAGNEALFDDGTQRAGVEEPTTAEEVSTAAASTVAALAFAANKQQQQDEANDGDDEGDEEGDDDDNNGWEGSGGGTKRDAGGAAGEGDAHNPNANSRKRRKL